MPVKLLGCAALLAACTHSRSLPQAFNDIEPNRWVTVRTTSGTLSAITVFTGTGIGFQAEGGGMIDPATIIRVTDERTLRGAAEGLGLGFAAGALTGVVIGLADGDDPPCDEGGHNWCLFNMTAGEKAIVGGVLLGGLGSIVGLAIGTVKGSDDVYEDASTFAITPGGPPGSIAGATLTF
jgi:hypothetical protein